MAAASTHLDATAMQFIENPPSAVLPERRDGLSQHCRDRVEAGVAAVLCAFRPTGRQGEPWIVNCGLNPRWEDGTIVVRARRSGLSCRSSGFGVLAAAGDAVVPELNLYCRAFPVAERDRRARGCDRLMRRAILAGVLLAR